MLHWPLQMTFMYVARSADVAFTWSWLFIQDPATRLFVLGPSPWVGDVATLLMLALLLGVSTLTYRFIETPWRARARSVQ